MAREVVTATFQVVDSRGNQSRMREFTRHESGRVIGGGEVVTGVVYRLDDGSEPQATIGGKSFFDRSTGEHYRRI